MVNRYRRKEVLKELVDRFSAVCKDIHTSNRESVKTTTKKFIIIKLPQGIIPYSDIHNIAYVQLQLYAKDISNGIENITYMEDLIDGVSALIPFDTDLMSCNNTPVQLPSKPDDMGYHSVIIQFKVVIKL